MERRIWIISVICSDWRTRVFRVIADRADDAIMWPYTAHFASVTGVPRDEVLDVQCLGLAASDSGFEFVPQNQWK